MPDRLLGLGPARGIYPGKLIFLEFDINKCFNITSKNELCYNFR